MSERSDQLHATADQQIGDLIDLIATLDEETSRRACPGRDKLGDYTADNTDLAGVAKRLSTTRDALRQIAQLTDGELDAIPPAGSFRFCDGRRTLERVVASLFKHQEHQLSALNAALA
jgi:hypothetical protein